MVHIWEYQDAIGITRRGAYLDSYDRGGSDIGVKFHRLDDQGKPIRYPNGGRECDIVSGAKLKAARRVGVMTLAEYKGV